MTVSDERLDVLAVAPHPDDLEILCGGTLALLVDQGYKVGILDLTSGEPTPRGTLETRAAEAEEARRILGVPLRINLGLPNRVLMDEPEHRFAVATVLRRLRPSIVIQMAGRTPAASPDHHQAHLLVEASRFYSQLTKWDERFDGTEPYRVPHLVYAPAPFDAEERRWHSTFVIDVEKTMERKLAAIRAYESQFDAARLEKVKHWLGGYNAAVGGRCGFRYGELFALPHPVGAVDLFRLVRTGEGTPAPVELPGRQALPLG
ncbi:MAG: PIG-L family deacetylase [Planctomycetia bacterium]